MLVKNSDEISTIVSNRKNIIRYQEKYFLKLYETSVGDLRKEVCRELLEELKNE